MKIKLLQSIFFLFFLSGISSAQIQYVSFGGMVGGGEISGNFSPVTSLNTNLFIEAIPWFSDGMFSFRTGFQYAQKIEKFLPQNKTNRYYPFIKSCWLKGVLKQLLSETFFLEGGAGLLILNDRVFNDNNNWNAGVSFNALAAIDLRKPNSDGISLGLGVDYGLTFTGTNTDYYSIYAQIQYYP
jgi:hypothetical protein